MKIVYLVKPHSENEELRHSLRSLANLKVGYVDEVNILGGKPRWLRNVTHYPFPQTRGKHENTSRMLFAYCLTNQGEFALFNDDFYLNKRLSQLSNYQRGKLVDVVDEYQNKARFGSKYTTNMQAAVEPIKQIIGKEPLAFNLHLPMIMDCEKYIAMCEQFGGQEWFNWNRRTLYGNLYCYHAPFHPDVKNIEELNVDYDKYDFLSTNDKTFASNSGISFYIKRKYQGKSDYEK
jgi:hypothetical protein